MSDTLPAQDCWFLTGATAVGKTAIGLALARRLGAEIISLDSMAIYRGMDIGTAKPTPQQQAELPHHLIDVADPGEDYSIARYLEAAHAKIVEIRDRGREVLFVGGTPLYLKALLRGLSTGPPADWQLREEIESEIAVVGSQALYDRLEQVDPVAASQIHPHDSRRLIRALEVFRATGQPISHQQLQFEESSLADQRRVFVLRRSREEQNQRIEQRVEQMIDRGLVNEVRSLTSAGKQLGRTAGKAVGYREVIDHFAGRIDAETMVEKIKASTRRFAKRQGTWFRSLSESRFLDLEGEVATEQIAQEVAQAGESAPR